MRRRRRTGGKEEGKEGKDMRELSIELQGISLALHGYATLTYPPFLLGLALSIKSLVYYPSPTLLPTLIGISY